MIRHTLPSVLWLLALNSACAAQSPGYADCLSRAHGNANAKFTCNQHELRIQDKRVDADYRRLQVRSQHDPQAQADVRTDQRDWLQHRDSVCSKAGGSEDLPCMIREAAAKADQLDARLR